MVAILEKGEFNTYFHPMVDFIATSPLRIETMDEGTHILATVDVKNINNKISKFLMYPRFLTICLRMSQFGPITHTHQYVGEGSSTPTEPHHTPSPEADTSHPTTSSIPLPSLPTAPIPLATIAKSSTLPHDSVPMVTSPTAHEGSMQQTISELTALCTSLQRQHSELLAKFQAREVEILMLKERVQVLEDRESVVAKQSRDDAPIKGRSINEGEPTAERISDDSEELARVLTSIDAATVLAGGIAVPTSSGSIPTDGVPATDISTSSEVAPTASLIVTFCSKRKGKEVMVEFDTLKKQRLQEQIDAQVARELEEQQEKEHMRMNEQIARDTEVVRIHANEELQEKANDQEAEEGLLYGYDQKQLRVEDFIPMGSKEEAERLKRKGLNLEQEHVKKQKTSEEAPEIENSTEEIPEEKMKEMIQFVPVEDVYV
nr:hypothetical protein [Tanacetum cinerariifolium]